MVVVVVVGVVVVAVVALDMATPSNHQKVAQNPHFFDTFDLDMCFAPQWRSENGVF